MSIFVLFPIVLHLILILPAAALGSYFLKVDRYLAPFLIYCCINIFVFLFATQGDLKNAVCCIYAILSCLALLTLFLSLKNSDFRGHICSFVKENFLFSLLLILSGFVFRDQIVGFGDEYNYWAIAVKEILKTHQLPGVESGLFFKSYHPGLTLFHYFNLFIFGYSESGIYSSYLALNLAAINVVHIRFRHKPFYGIFAYFILLFIGYRALGLGIKSLIGDQFLIFGYFSCLILLFTSFNKIKNWILLPMITVILAKQPGLAIAYFIFAIWLAIHLRNLYRIRFEKRQTIKTLLVVVLTFVCIQGAGRLWLDWANAHRANGLFLTTMHPESTGDYLDRLWKEGPNPKENEIIRGFFTELPRLPFGMPLEGGKLKDKWPMWSWGCLMLLMIFISSWPAEKFEFPLRNWILLFLSLVSWSLGLLVLYTKVFSQVHEGPYPSMDRYFSIVFTPLFLFSSYLTFLAFEFRKKPIWKCLILSLIAFMVVFLPRPGGFLLSEREEKQGRDESEFFKVIKSEFLQVADVKSTVCFVYQGPYPFVQRAIYEISPAKHQIVGLIDVVDFSNLGQNPDRCSHALGFCLGPDECQKAFKKLPHLFNSSSESQAWLVPWSEFKSHLNSAVGK